MIEYSFSLEELADISSVKRVHAVLLTNDGRVLLRFKNGEARLTGGRIDNEDADIVAALHREIKEEINCDFDLCDYVGFVEASVEGGERELWVRYVVRVTEIGDVSPDPDREGEWIYGRMLAPYEEAKAEMTKASFFADSNQKFLDKAYEIARQRGYFTEPINKEVSLINPESLGGVNVPRR